jgi:type IV secretory pathway VirB2 component (pilin)
MAGPSTSGLVGAANWLVDLIQGPLALSLAVVSIAGAGYALLNGRLELLSMGRRVVGVFVLLGAVGLASTFMHLAGAPIESAPAKAAPLSAPTVIEAPQVAPQSPPEDPYAGASVPVR